MDNMKNTSYTEITIETKGTDHSQNPLSKTYLYEYALLCAVSDLFGSVESRSNVEPLKLNFAELPDERKETGKVAEQLPAGNKKKTKEEYMKEVSNLVEAKVSGHVKFPMMHICRAEMSVIPEEDGTHTFCFTDGIYGFSVHITVPRKGHPREIVVIDLRTGQRLDPKDEKKKKEGRRRSSVVGMSVKRGECA
ncbi:MAG: hypothetical protein K5888_01030 [Lachnospiraceae bacterium]|nr:hypothetical protein [Lachnospiraceae bacterium]